MANYLPSSFESNVQRSGNIVIDLSGNNQNYTELISAYDSAKTAIYLGDGWCTFPDLDNFDSEKLLRAFTLKEKDSCDSIWDPSLTYTDSCHRTSLSISALRQLEALFNLSQLLFGLSRAETVNYTFRDLQLKKHPHSFKKSGFKQLNFDGRTDFYAIFEQLVNIIIEEGGLEVTLLMYKNPMLPMVRQKCLDLISNVATVPDVAFKIMRHQSWFLDHLLILVRDGEIVSDKIPALSVLIRLLKVMLTERMISAYMKLVDMQYIDCLVDIFENPAFTESSEFLPFFIKFEFITMQSLTVILGDLEYSQLWSDKAKTRLLNYCMIVFLKAAGAYPPGDRIEQINHIFYAEQHTNKHSLAHTIMTVTELLRNDDNMKLFYRYHRPFKQLIIQLYKKYGAKSQYIRTDPGISYALNHLMRVLYIKNIQTPSTTSSSIQHSAKSHQSYSSKNMLNTYEHEDKKAPRICSNPDCKNEETKYKKFKICMNCNGQAAYCSSKCKKAHIGTHMINECRRDELIYNKKSETPEKSDEMIYENLKINKQKQQVQPSNNIGQSSYNRIYSSTSTSNYQKNVRRASENLHQKNYQDHFQKLNDIQNQKRRESSGGRECNQVISKKKLSKFCSVNDNQRRSSLNNEQDNIKSTSRVQVRTVYAKHTSSMKESKSVALRRLSATDEDSNKLKLLNSRDNHQTKSIIDTTTSSFQFHRPLKTSTQLCLPDLTRRQSLKEERLLENLKEDQTIYKQENGLAGHQSVNQLKSALEPMVIQKNSDSSSSYASNISSSESASISSSLSNNNPQKKFKATNGNKAIPKIEKIKESKIREREKKKHSEEMEILKHRHSTTSAILTSTSTSSSSSSTMQTTVKNMTPQPNSKDLNSIEATLFYRGISDQDKDSGNNSEAIQYLNNMENSSSNDDENEGESDDDDDTDQENEIENVFSDNSLLENSTQSSVEQNEGVEKELRNESDHEVKVQKYKSNIHPSHECNDEEDEIESERWTVSENGQNIRSRNLISNHLNPSSKNFREDDSENSNSIKETRGHESSEFSVINEDEHERRSHFKVVKEFEKTLEFVKNASNLKVMPSLSINQQNNEELFNQQKQSEEPHISLASLYYDETENHKLTEQICSDKNQLKLMSSDDEENDTDSDSNSSKNPEFTKRPSLKGRNLAKGLNLIINNSIDSHMLKNSYSLKVHSNGYKENGTGIKGVLNRKNTDGNLKNHYQKNFINSIGINNNTSTPYLGLRKPDTDEIDGYRGADFNSDFQHQGNENERINVNQEVEFTDDEMSLFKNKNETLTTNRLSDYKSFKTPLMPPVSISSKENLNIIHGAASASNLQSNINTNNRRSVLINNELILNQEKDFRNSNNQQQQQIFIQKHTELKVFNNVNTNLTINSLNQTEASNNGAIKAEPKNSTPISTDLNTQQHLSAKHRHFLNAQLDLTIVPSKKQQPMPDSKLKKNTNSPNQQLPVFLVPQVPSIQEERMLTASSTPLPSSVDVLKKTQINSNVYKTSTLKSNSNLKVNSEINKKKIAPPLLTSDILDVSKISALENATSTNECVVVAKMEMPRDLKKCLKDEMKKDKKQCSIS